MLVSGFAAGPWGTNCWIVASAEGNECLVIDPGLDAMPAISDKMHSLRLKPVAVLLTHGHVDHMWSVTPVANGYSIPAYICGPDRRLLANPELALSEEGRAMVKGLGGEFVEPDEVVEVQDNIVLDMAGLKLSVWASPGHTPGSAVFNFEGDVPRMFSGDVLFKGSIGRTDLPGGSDEDMLKSLARLCTAPRDTLVFPGHGQPTVIAAELETNPYLQKVKAGESV